MSIGYLKNSTTLSNAGLNRELVDALVNDNPEQERVLEQFFAGPSNDNTSTKWQELKQGKTWFTLEDLAAAVRELEQHGFKVNTNKVKGTQNTPLAHHAFYEALGKGIEDAAKVAQQIEALRADSKKHKGYLSKAFSVFAHEKPVEKIVSDIVAFEKHCRDNGINYDDAAEKLVAGEKPKGVIDKIADMRFLLAAVGGGALGLMGINVAEHLPALNAVPDAFFTALPYFAVPFVGLSLFKAFSEKNFRDEWTTFARFVATMGAGFVIGAGVTSVMAGHLPHIDPAALQTGAQAAKSALTGHHGFSPSEYILQTMAAFAAFSGLYKMAKKDNKLRAEGAEAPKKTGFARFFNKVSGIFVNKHTSPAIAAAGNFTEKAADFMDKRFVDFMNFVGLPAITILMSKTLSDGGLSKIASYSGYYETVFMGMAVCAAALATTSYLYGARKDDFKSIAKTVSTAFGLSSGLATMPVTKQSLKEMGVSERTREFVVPLSANFNMLGTSLYLGMTAMCANIMVGHDMDLMQKAAVMAIVVLHGYGAPGIPASNLSLLSNVLGVTGLSNAAIQKVYEMVLPGDRLLDMSQTALNVWGDMMVAVGADKRMKINRAKHINQIREERKMLEGGAETVPDAEIVAEKKPEIPPPPQI